MSPFNITSRTNSTLLGIIAIILVFTLVYSHLRMNSLSQKISDLNGSTLALSTALSSTTEVLQASIKDTNNSLFNALSIEQKNVGAIKEQLGGFKNQVGTLSGTLTNLQKLARLILNYSKNIQKPESFRNCLYCHLCLM